MATPLSSVSGLISGIDYKALVEQIIAAERAPADRLRARAKALTSKVEALGTWRGLLGGLRSAADKFRTGGALSYASTLVSKPPSGKTLLAASAGATASPGSYAVEVLATAQAEKLSGTPAVRADTALGLAGEFLVNGRRVEVKAGDTLLDVRDRINAVNSGTARSGVTASVLTTGGTSRLILTSDTAGTAGIGLLDGRTGVLAQLGFIDGSTRLRHATSAGAASDRLTDAATAIATLRGLTGAGGQVTVQAAGQDVVIDLATDTLTTLAAKFDALAGVTASVQSEGTGADARYWLDIRGTTAFTDAGRTLEQLGILEGNHGAIAQVVRGAVLTAGDGTTPATAATRLDALWSNGAAAGVQVGDTLTITGTRGNGTTVSLTYTVGADHTLQHVLDVLNDPATGFGAGTRPATASIGADGRLQLTDATAGDSRLAVSIVAHNQGGGTLDLGSFTAATVGRARQLVAGSDAVFKVDGVSFTRTSNTVTDAIVGVTMNLLAAEEGAPVELIVNRDQNAAKAAAEELVAAWNKVVEYIKTQQAAPKEGAAAPVLYGDPLLRLTRSLLPSTMLRPVTGAAPGLETLATAGFSLDGSGKMTLDAQKLLDAFTERNGDLRMLFTEAATVDDARFRFVSTSGRASGGTHVVNVTTAATCASATCVGFSGPYVDDGTADTLRVTDTATGGVATVALAHGMTAQQIADALNASLRASVTHKAAASDALYADAGATTPATAATTLASLHMGNGTAAGVLAGDTITFTGTSAAGTAITGSFTVTDPATQTLGDLVATLQAQFGTGATVSVEGGRIVVQAAQAGKSSVTLALSAQNQGGGALALGASQTLALGRGALGMTASWDGMHLRLAHDTYGSAQGFSLAFQGGGADGTAQLGIAAGAYAGVDVAGTIDGIAATGAGRQLTGTAGSDHDGLVVEYTGADTSVSTTLSLVVGTASLLERQLDTWLRAGDGSIATKETESKTSADRFTARAELLEQRLEQRRTQLLLRYTQMETALAKLQRSSASLTGLLNQNGGK